MIVIYFWYIVCNVIVHLSGLNIIYTLIPGCRGAIVAEDAYAYPEEKTDKETFSPELIDPVGKNSFRGVTEDVYAYSEEHTDQETFSPELTDPVGNNSFRIRGVTEGIEQVGELEDISKAVINGSNVDDVFAAETSTESITTSPTFVSKQTNNSFEALTKISDLYTDSTTTTTATPASTSCSNTSTKSIDLYSEPITETTTSSTFVSSQVNNSFAQSTNSSDLYTDSITTPTPSTSSLDTSIKSTDLYTELMTEITTSPTFVSSQVNNSFEASTNSSNLYTDLITDTIELYTAEQTTQPVSSDLCSNDSESTTIQLIHTDPLTNTTTTTTQALFSELSTSNPEPTTNIIESTTNTVPISEQASVTLALISDSQDLSLLTNVAEESTDFAVETSTQPLMLNLSEHLESKLPANDSLAELFDDVTTHSTTRLPVYEEGYHDPKKAPTRYGQGEEYVTTTSWKYASDYGIGIRDYNLILYAVNNSAVLEKGSLLNYVYFVFKEVLLVNMTLCDIRYCRYLRSKTHDNTKKVPPVLVAFTKMDVKNEILHKRKMLRPTGIKVEHDMPKKILDEQNALLKPLMDKYRAMGQYVVVRSGKLLVEGKVLTQINLPDKYTYDPLQTFVSYVSTTYKSTTPGMQLPREFKDYGFAADKKSGKKKKGVKGAGGGKKKRKPVIRIPLDEEVGEELSALVLFTTRKYWL